MDGVLQMVVRDVPAETMRDFSAMGGEHFPKRGGIQATKLGIYPLVNIQKAMENHYF